MSGARNVPSAASSGRDDAHRRVAPGAAPRTVVIGDLNGADDALIEILRGTGLIDARLRWVGGRAELVQVGDLFNRGGGARAALELLTALKRSAERAGGRVTVLLGNHEVMTALGNEAYCTEEEYLSFASKAELRAWPQRVQRAARRLYRSELERGSVLPFEPRLAAWKVLNAPGRLELRRALRPSAKLGKLIRSLPLVYQREQTVYVHGGLLPRWAALGVGGLNAALRAAWAGPAKRYLRVPKTSLLRHVDGPLWDRSLALGGASALSELKRSLKLLGARRMVVGHTQTVAVPGGESGRILCRHGGRLVLADVGLGQGEESPRAALVIEGACGFEWSRQGKRLLWRDRD